MLVFIPRLHEGSIMKYNQVIVKDFSPDSPFDPADGNVFYWNNTSTIEPTTFSIDETGLIQLIKDPSLNCLTCNVFQTHSTEVLNASKRYLVTHRGEIRIMRYGPVFETPIGCNRIDNGSEMSIILENSSYQIRPNYNNLEIVLETEFNKSSLLIGSLINRLSSITKANIPTEIQEDILFDVLQKYFSEFGPDYRISSVKLIGY